MTDYVGLWDCHYCGEKGIEGYTYDCPGCGRPRAKDVRFYLPTSPKVATPEQMALMGHDPNWYCLYCGSGNKDENTTCWNCGAEKGAAPEHQRHVYMDDDVPHSEEEAEVDTPVETANYTEPESWEPYREALRETIKKAQVTTQTGKRVLVGIGVALVFLLAFLLYQFFFNTHTASAYIDGFSWKRNVAFQEYKTLHEEGWSVPAGGRTTGSTRKQNGTVRISDGYTTESYTDTCYRYETQMDTCYRSVYNPRTCTSDNGNGSFSTYDCGSSSTESYSCSKSVSVPYSCTKTRQVEQYHYEPTYGTWYYYDIDRWVTTSNYPTEASDHSPYYSKEPTASGDKERLIDQPGVYTTYFVCDETGDFSRNYDLNDWSSQKIGDEYTVTTNYWKVVLNVEASK